MFTIRNARREEYPFIGRLMVEVYSALDGFPKADELPAYYDMLANVGELTKKPETEILVGATSDDRIAGAVVFFGDVQHYGSGGTATQERKASGFRLLAVAKEARGNGLARALTLECIRKAREKGQKTLIIHTTRAMQTAWNMYEKIGFERAEDLDFVQGNVSVFGFRFHLDSAREMPLGNKTKE